MDAGGAGPVGSEGQGRVSSGRQGSMTRSFISARTVQRFSPVRACCFLVKRKNIKVKISQLEKIVPFFSVF